MRTPAARALFGLALGLSSHVALAQGIELNQAPEILEVGSQFDAQVEPSTGLSIEQVVSGPRHHLFTTVSKLQNHYPRTPVWLRLELRNGTADELERVLALDTPVLSRAEGYQVDPASRVSTRLTDSAENGTDLHGFAFKLAAGQSTELYLRIATPILLETAAHLYAERAFTHRDQGIQRLFNLYFGIFLALFAYNLMLWISIRDVDYLYYLVFEGMAALGFLFGSGMARVYLGPNELWPRLFIAPTALSVVAGLLFVRRFLNTRALMPLADRIILGMAAAQTICLIVSPARLTPFTGTIGNALYILASAFLLAVAAVIARKGSRAARYFLLSWSLSLGGVLIWGLARTGVLPHNLFTYYAPVPGVALEMMIIAFALADKINDARKKLTEARGAAIVDLAGGISHEINNPLTAIGLATQHLQAWLPGALDPSEGEAALNQLGMIRKMVVRITQIIQGLRAFARDASNDPYVPARVGDIVAATLELCAEKVKHQGVALETMPMPEGAVIRCRAIEIQQALLSLVQNALDAATQCAPGERWVRVQCETEPAWLELSVSDSGPGVSPSIRDRIFQPFFTTKGEGRAVGLGLSMAKGIVESHQGQLSLDARASNTRFVMRLPRAADGSAGA